jgi:glycogen synthase
MTTLDYYDRLFTMRLEQWTPLSRVADEHIGLVAPEAGLDAMPRFPAEARTVIQLAFENRYASLGGLAPATKHLAGQLEKMGERVLFFTPYHSGCQGVRSARKAGLLERRFCDVPFSCGSYSGVFSCYRDTSVDLPSYFIEIPGRFSAVENPYGYENPDELLLDSLAFVAAVPFALRCLSLTEGLLFHAHEWEMAPIAITATMAMREGVLHSARTILTLHNSFDSALPTRLRHHFFGKGLKGETVLQCSIPLLSGPLTTVSTPFARELTHDPLQRTNFAPHLQTVFSMNPPLGVENGLFSEASAPYTPPVVRAAIAGRVERLLARKHTYRTRFLQAVARFRDNRNTGALEIDFSDRNIPVFFMAGRLDIMQKGFDVIFCAFERLKRGSAKLFFCPSRSSKNFEEELKFFNKIAVRCKGDVEIWPSKIPRRVYELVLRGSSFLLMPSLYEPFGSANEGMAAGTPVIARGTGGLWIQVNTAFPVTVPAFYGTLPLDGNEDRPTGILFREAYPDARAGREWGQLLKVSPAERKKLPLFESLVSSAHTALTQAVDLYSRPDDYAKLILNGLEEVKKFSWERAALKYKRVYDAAVERGRL